MLFIRKKNMIDELKEAVEELKKICLQVSQEVVTLRNMIENK